MLDRIEEICDELGAELILDTKTRYIIKYKNENYYINENWLLTNNWIDSIIREVRAYG